MTACCAQGGSAVLACFILHPSYFILSPRVVREGVARFAQGAGFHLVIRPVEHFADAAADEIGDGDLRGGMDVAGERIAPPPPQQAIHFGRDVEVSVFLSRVVA